MIEDPKFVMVLRLGKISSRNLKDYISVDPIEEVKVIALKYGRCHFAKFGKRIESERINGMIADGKLFLLLAEARDGKTKTETFLINSASNSLPLGSYYPEYYKKCAGSIGLWLELKESEQKFSLSELIVKSSAQPVILSMSKSSSSYFFCIPKIK